jgi:hypothetical protein
MTTTDFIPLTAAARQAGVSRSLLGRRVARGELPTYRDPRDHRVTLVRAEDLARFRAPVPATPAVEVEATA